MPRSIYLLVMMVSTVSFGQTISINFKATGTATRIDSVTASNLNTGQSMTIPGNETLLLTTGSGIPESNRNDGPDQLYPNPFSGTATFSTVIEKPQTICVRVQDFAGRIVAQAWVLTGPGEHGFEVSTASSGLYVISLTTEHGSAGYKVISTGAGARGNAIQYKGMVTGPFGKPFSPALKGSLAGNVLGYSPGDIIHYRCISGGYVTIFTDSPESSTEYEVEFIACTDQGNRSYSVVKIGGQVWMAENLAYLPSVQPSSAGSETAPYYYVYGSETVSVSVAGSSPNYKSYGALYNWPAALTACPVGWHLPFDGEWKVLETYLGMSQAESDAVGMRNSGSVGKKLKSATGWVDDGNGNNISGFHALPGGYRFTAGGFNSLDSVSVFWSASPILNPNALYRRQSYDNDGVTRTNHYMSNGFSVRCLKGGTKPTAGFTVAPSIGTTATLFLFDASGSFDRETPAGELEVRWDFNGDGTWDTGYDKTKTNPHQYAAAGSYPVIMEVKNGEGLVDAKTETVVVADGTLSDNRDGRTYHYRAMGTQTWTLENMAYLPSVAPSSGGSETNPIYYVNGYEGTNANAAITSANYSVYGALYNWEAAKTACPPGWHLPSDAAWTTLENFLGGINVAGGKMKGTGTAFWAGPNTGATNESGFSALPCGGRDPGGNFILPGRDAGFWSATASGTSLASSRGITYNSNTLTVNAALRSFGHSVRCLKTDSGNPGLPTVTTSDIGGITNESATSGGNVTEDGFATVTSRGVCWSKSEYPTTRDSISVNGGGKGNFLSYLAGLTANTIYYVRAYATNSVGTAYGEQKQFATTGGGGSGSFDYQGRTYAYKTIGAQTWMTENLAYLPSVSPSSEGSGTTPYYYVYDYEGTSTVSAKVTENYATYGVLYNWEAAKTACPPGWRLPSDSEWTALTDFLGSQAGGQMKETGTSHWQSPNAGATNSSGFAALPGGYRYNDGGFDNMGFFSFFWTSSEGGMSSAGYVLLSHDADGVDRSYYHWAGGFSVRCLRN